MIPSGRLSRLGAGILVPLLAFLAFSCGSNGSNFAGGGTGGTGISTGSISGFGSVVVNGVHFRTDNSTKKMVNGADKSRQADREVFYEGMVVTVRHVTGDNNAVEIEYRNNLLGPVADKTDNVIVVLGQTVVVDNTTIFNGTNFASLRRDDIVEVSGLADNAGRIRATYIVPVLPPMPPPVQKFEVKGFVSESSSNGFRLGPLPDGSAMTVMVSYTPGGPPNGTYAQVITTDREPVGGSIKAAQVEILTPRTGFPENSVVDLEGLVTTPWTGSGNDLSFRVEGKIVRWEDNTVFVGGFPNDTRQANREVQVQGLETGGAISAAKIVIR